MSEIFFAGINVANNYNSGNFNTVDEIKSRCNIVDVIGKVVALKKAGSVYKGLCPFHNEKTPSFAVYETSQRYVCFGCNESGDVLNFVQKYYNLDFKEAVEMLAKEYGIEVSWNFEKSGHNDELYEINRQAAIFFFRALRQTENPAYPYMKGRGMSDETLKNFGIGYADADWSSLTDYLTSEKGYDPEKLVKLGLTSVKNGKYYDYFRDRVMFPIQNTAGKVIGFGGRIINNGGQPADKKAPKYLNSCESPVFQKKSNLYGMNVTKDYVKKEDSIILVEGYMDVISLYQAGIRNVSASLGTALTENQARLIKRYTSNVILSYDSDDAGQNATMRGLDILYGQDCRVRVLKVNDGKDPDEFIKAKGRDAYLKLAEEAIPFGDYKLMRAGAKYDFEDNQQKLAYLRDAIAILRGMKPVEADMYIGRISEETGISEMAIRREYEDRGDEKAASAFAYRPEKTAQDGVSEGEMDLLKLMLMDHEFTNIPEDIKDCIFLDPRSSMLYSAIQSIDSGQRPLDREKLTDMLDIETSQLLEKISAKIIPGDKEDKIFSDCISYIRRSKLEKEAGEIMALLQNEEKLDPDEQNYLLQRQIEIQKKLMDRC